MVMLGSRAHIDCEPHRMYKCDVDIYIYMYIFEESPTSYFVTLFEMVALWISLHKWMRMNKNKVT